MDKDRWQDTQLQLLYDWSQSDERYGLAVSNPMFEYGLLLHFEDGNVISSARDCTSRLKRHLPDYDKNLQVEILRPNVSTALSRAENRDNPPCTDWPRNTGTTVYRLVKALARGR